MSSLFGWLESLDVPSALNALAPMAPDTLAVVTMLDSSENVQLLPSFVPALRRTEIPHRVTGAGVSLSVHELLRVERELGLLHGFDELWLCNSWNVEPKPPGLRLTSDVPLDATPQGANEWMTATGCHTGLGDGDGLNFITLDENVARVLRQRAKRD